MIRVGRWAGPSVTIGCALRMKPGLAWSWGGRSAAL